MDRPDAFGLADVSAIRATHPALFTFFHWGLFLLFALAGKMRRRHVIAACYFAADFAMRPPLHFAITTIHHRLSVTMIATRRNVLATDPRIECMIAPFNFCVFAHGRIIAPVPTLNSPLAGRRRT